ncbi:MAG TPA: M20/M25/M40 family metallo-hydrolase [Ktedonobacteraceae bacterium]|nr:M20/M25/M40 family metallo-hydrolase [Ktedonobacteraceae bacterium]
MREQERIAAIIQSHFQQEVAFLQRLISAKSSNPFTPDTSRPDVPIEAEVASIIYQELQSLGYQAKLVGISPQRPNVLCHIPGNGSSQKTLILSTHMDTVEPDNYTRDPWGAQIEAGRLYGVGAADAKAQIAAFLYAIQALHQSGIPLAGNITLAFVVDEETGACSPYGTHYLLQQDLLHGDAAIIGEPGDDKIAIGHRGLYRFRLQVKGEATHTGLKAWETGERGRNAILDVARLVQVLAEQQLPDTPSDAFPGRRSVLTFPTLIKGGSGINVVPGTCEAYGDVRLLPGLSATQVRTIIQKYLRRLDIQEYQLDDLLDIPAVEIQRDVAIVQHLAAAVEIVTGKHLRVEGSGPACDGWMFIQRGIPTVCGYGVKCGSVHGADEWTDLKSLNDLTEIYACTIARFFEYK